VLQRQDACEVLGMVVDELADAEEDVRAARERHRAPARERALRRLDCSVDLLDAREVDLAALLAGRGVVDGAAAAGGALDPLAVDPVRDPGYLARTHLGELIRNLGHAGLPSGRGQPSATGAG